MTRKKKLEDNETPLLEWICGGAGALLFFVIVGFTLFNGMTMKGPAAFRYQTTGMEAVADGTRQIAFLVENIGEKPVTDLRVRVTLMNGDQDGQQRDINVETVAAKSTVKATAVFTDPAAAEVKFETLSYREP